MAFKERVEVTDGMFEPLKETIELLRTYNLEIPDDVHIQLQVGKITRIELSNLEYF